MNWFHFLLISIYSVLANDNKLDEYKRTNDFTDIFFEVLEPKEVSYTYRVRPSHTFGSSFKDSYKNVKLVPTIPFDACGTIENLDDVHGNVAFVQRGQCSFVTKASNCENSGALAVLVMDNEQEADRLIDMIDDNTNREVNIPSAFLIWRDGHMIKSSIEFNDLIGATINIPLNITFKNIHNLKKAPWAYW